jgi:hypothetical protein
VKLRLLQLDGTALGAVMPPWLTFAMALNIAIWQLN